MWSKKYIYFYFGSDTIGLVMEERIILLDNVILENWKIFYQKNIITKKELDNYLELGLITHFEYTYITLF